MWKVIVAAIGVAGFAGAAMSVDARQGTASRVLEAAADGSAALLCEEQNASVASGNWIFGSRRDSMRDVYALVTDPSGACNHPDVQQAAGFEDEGGSCYILRRIGTGDPDLPMSCVERNAGTAGAAGVSVLECSGWGSRLNAMVDGGFSLAIEATETLEARTSHGVCSAL
ncbi:MAG: hypothetical protein AAF698_12575 [Pseudomonadota bacterium]